MPKTNLKPKARASSLQRMVRLRSDLQWCYDRLSHLLYIWENPESVQAGFGPNETMTILADDLPTIRAMHKLTDCYEHKQPNDKLCREAGQKDANEH